MAHSEIINSIVSIIFDKFSVESIRTMGLPTFCKEVETVAAQNNYQLTYKDKNAVIVTAARKVR